MTAMTEWDRYCHGVGPEPARSYFPEPRRYQAPKTPGGTVGSLLAETGSLPLSLPLEDSRLSRGRSQSPVAAQASLSRPARARSEGSDR
jgi:hypothetical protein